jgi:predicted O-methyltransferase YrrM
MPADDAEPLNASLTGGCFAGPQTTAGRARRGAAMFVYGNAALDQLVKIDASHVEFLRALVMCQKPRRVLEFGFGTGEATRAILAGLHYNRQGFDYTVVDNWLDFRGVQPEVTWAPDYQSVSFVTSSEKDFVFACQSGYDFILSDADHDHTQEWFDLVYHRLLAAGGTLIYHDVTNSVRFPNLLSIYAEVVRNGYRHVLLNRNSLPDERCDRGLLAIFKH